MFARQIWVWVKLTPRNITFAFHICWDFRFWLWLIIYLTNIRFYKQTWYITLVSTKKVKNADQKTKCSPNQFLLCNQAKSTGILLKKQRGRQNRRNYKNWYDLHDKKLYQLMHLKWGTSVVECNQRKLVSSTTRELTWSSFSS